MKVRKGRRSPVYVRNQVHGEGSRSFGRCDVEINKKVLVKRETKMREREDENY